MQAHFVIQSYQILNMLKVANLALILGQTHAVPINMNLLKNLLKVKLLQLRDLYHPYFQYQIFPLQILFKLMMPLM